MPQIYFLSIIKIQCKFTHVDLNVYLIFLLIFCWFPSDSSEGFYSPKSRFNCSGTVLSFIDLRNGRYCVNSVNAADVLASIIWWVVRESVATCKVCLVISYWPRHKPANSFAVSSVRDACMAPANVFCCCPCVLWNISSPADAAACCASFSP